MTFVNILLGLLQSGISYIGNVLYSIIDFIAKPLSYIFYFIDGIFYFFVKLFEIVISVIKIFVALIQFFASIVSGLFRIIGNMLTVDFTTQPINYPSETLRGINTVMDLVRPMGLLDIVPAIILALVWFAFAVKIIGLLGGELKSNA
jgi:phage-related protein